MVDECNRKYGGANVTTAVTTTYQTQPVVQQPYVPPQQGYIPPQQGYISPQQGYAPPQQGYIPPQQGYIPPQQGYVQQTTYSTQY